MFLRPLGDVHKYDAQARAGKLRTGASRFLLPTRCRMSGVMGRPVLTSATPAAPRHTWSPSRTSAITPGMPARCTLRIAVSSSTGLSEFFMTFIRLSGFRTTSITAILERGRLEFTTSFKRK